MREVLSFVRAYDAYFLLGLTALGLILVICILSLSAKMGKIMRRRSAQGTEGGLEGVMNLLTDQSNALSSLQRRFDEIAVKQEEAGNALPGCLRNVGMVRFNAFDDVGGEQSFALALLDAKKNGVVISSLYGRQESRLYAKNVVNGEGERAFSDEERRALESA